MKAGLFIALLLAPTLLFAMADAKKRLHVREISRDQAFNFRNESMNNFKALPSEVPRDIWKHLIQVDCRYVVKTGSVYLELSHPSEFLVTEGGVALDLGQKHIYDARVASKGKLEIYNFKYENGTLAERYETTNAETLWGRITIKQLRFNQSSGRIYIKSDDELKTIPPTRREHIMVCESLSLI